ncbi:MAG: O-antigen ligase family protein [Armatimonadetes bacterium]|nr:O-antigen ligase family protein [Armatimonadota bacterium]
MNRRLAVTFHDFARNRFQGHWAPFRMAWAALCLAAGIIAVTLPPLLAAGIAGAAVLFVLGWTRPAWLPILIIGLSPLTWSLTGENSPIRFGISELCLGAFAMASFPRSLLNRRALSAGPLNLPIFLFLGWSLVTAVHHWYPQTALVLVQMALYLWVVPVLFADLRGGALTIWRGLKLLAVMDLCIGIGVLALFLMGERQGVFLFGLHKNSVGSSLAAGLILFITMSCEDHNRKRIYAFGALMIGAALFATLSRGAWLGAAAGLGILISIKGYDRRLSLLAAAIFLLCLWMFLLLPERSFNYLTFGQGPHQNLTIRMDTYREGWLAFTSSPIFGQGPGIGKESSGFNSLYLMILAESGLPGLILFGWLIISTFKMYRAAHRIAGTDSVERRLIAIAAAVTVCYWVHAAIDLYWGRGIMLQWACIGAVIGIWQKHSSTAIIGDDTASGLNVRAKP